MKVSSFRASGVHGYLPIAVTFLPDLTFLTGLNGSGKTTALRLLMGLLTPQLDQLASIDFASADVVVHDGDTEITIGAARTDSGMELKISTLEEPLRISAAVLQLLADRRERERDSRAPTIARTMRHAVAKSISRITTPMFLGLDRRLEYVHSDPNVPAGASVEMERRELLLWRHRGLVDERTTFASTNATGLAEIQVLVQETLLSVRAAQDELDRALRAEMLVDALKYVPTAPSMERPNRKALDAYKARKAQIETATTRLALPPEEVQNALTSFFDKMDEVVGRLEHPAAGAADRSKGKKNARSQAEAKEYSRNVEWMLNKSQADRIFGHLERLTVYERRHDDLQEPIDRYLKLANGFLEQTKKQIVIDDTGRLSVSFGEGKRQAISALSSGERQIVVMLAHLSLNKQLQTSGVFIVDEPELSLHVSWQEMFVDAIREANPNVQLIMATHSPAIILDRDAACVSLS